MPLELSVVIPMFNEEESIAVSYQRLTKVMQGMGVSYELIFVNDGSRDRTMEIMTTLQAEDKHIKLLSFSRNFGHQLAVSAGMKYTSGQAVVIIDADLQDPPEVIPDMVKKWKEGYDIVYGQREKRQGETFFKLLTAKVYYRILNKLTNNLIPVDTGDFRLIDKKVVDTLNNMPEHARFLRGMSSWAGFRSTPYLYKRDERFAGQTKYTLKKMFKLASDGIFSFSVQPLSLPWKTGTSFCVLAVIWLIILLILSLCSVAYGSWQLVTAFCLLFQGITLITLGFFGAYIGRIYEEVKGRPLYVIAREIGFREEKENG